MKTETGKEGTTGMDGIRPTKRTNKKQYKVLRDGSVVRIIDRCTAITLWKDKHNTDKIYMIIDDSGKYLCEKENDLYNHDQQFALYCGKIWDMADDYNRITRFGYGLQQETDK